MFFQILQTKHDATNHALFFGANRYLNLWTKKQMLIADLKTICASCDGSGFQAGFDEWGSLQANLRRSCPLCSGKGYTLTELGQDLWKLFRPLVKDLIQEELRQETNF